jgi:hypothetical protein
VATEITTNNVPRDIIDAAYLTPAEREEFDYLNWPAIDKGTDTASFFRYKGELYDLGTFMRLEATPGWDGGMAVSWSFAIVVRYVNDNEQVVVGTAIEKG